MYFTKKNPTITHPSVKNRIGGIRTSGNCVSEGTPAHSTQCHGLVHKLEIYLRSSCQLSTAILSFTQTYIHIDKFNPISYTTHLFYNMNE